MPELSAFKVAVANRKPVQYHEPNCRAARLTRNLSREILDRIAMKNKQRDVA
jgi:MinD-like ATPase involved in chromosome partitioning or flagellar assembly